MDSKLSIAALISVVAFIAIVYVALPKILENKITEKDVERWASPTQLAILNRGEASAKLMNKSQSGKIVTTDDLYQAKGSAEIAEVFPPNLIFPNQPTTPIADQRDITRDQSIALLENQVVGLQTQLRLLSTEKSGGWDWADKIGAAAIWIVGVIMSSILKAWTESIIKKHTNWQQSKG